MLTEERYATILRILEEKKAVTVLDLTNKISIFTAYYKLNTEY